MIISAIMQWTEKQIADAIADIPGESAVTSINGMTGDVVIEEGVSSWNDLTDKPFSKETTETLLFTGDNLAFDSYLTGTGCYSYHLSNPSFNRYCLVNRKKYRVVFDGEEYICSPYFSEYYHYLGNAAIYEDGSYYRYADTGEPFLISIGSQYDSDSDSMTIKTPATDIEYHSVSITEITETYHKLDDAYVSENNFVVTVDYTGSETETDMSSAGFMSKTYHNGIVDKTFTDIYNAYEDGKNIYAIIKTSGEESDIILNTCTASNSCFEFAFTLCSGIFTQSGLLRIESIFSRIENEFSIMLTQNIVGKNLDYIPKIYSANAGQIVSVNAVDNDGVPMGWEAIDIPVTSVNGMTGDVVINSGASSWNDIDDKPFYTYVGDTDNIIERKYRTYTYVRDGVYWCNDTFINQPIIGESYNLSFGSFNNDNIVCKAFDESHPNYSSSKWIGAYVGNLYLKTGLESDNTGEKSLVIFRQTTYGEIKFTGEVNIYCSAESDTLKDYGAITSCITGPKLAYKTLDDNFIPYRTIDWCELENRPFCDEYIDKFRVVGNADDKFTFEGRIYYKSSEITPSIAELTGAYASYENAFSYVNDIDVGSGCIYWRNSGIVYFIVAYRTDIIVDGVPITAPAPGFYFVYSFGNDEVTSAMLNNIECNKVFKRVLNESFIPDTVPRVNTVVNAGQIVAVKSVEAGVPTEWEVIDMPKIAAIADITTAPTMDDFNTLLSALRNSGLMSTL